VIRGPLAWILAIIGGIVVVLIVTAAIGNRDNKGDTVPATTYAQSVCGVAGTWRGEMEAILDEIRQAPSRGDLGVEEPQSQTPQGRRELVRTGLESSVRATKSLVEGIDNAGIPETPGGENAAKSVSAWADSAVDDLEKAQDALHQEADTLEGAVGQFTQATTAIRSALAGGVKTLADVARDDPQLVAAFRDSSTCQQLREEQSST
jgi:hypothetical protein